MINYQHAFWQFGGIPPRGRDVEEFEDQGTWVYSFAYTFEGKPYRVEFERQYKLAPNLIDAVIDNHQIKTNGKIIIPERAGQRHETV